MVRGAGSIAISTQCGLRRRFFSSPEGLRTYLGEE